MSCGEIEWGKCDICGKEAALNRKYFYYPIKCECHAPQHFEIVWHCANCEPKEPLETKIRLKTDALKKLAQYEDLEEQGLLVRLPCKVGDTVYGIYNDLDLGICIKANTVTEITYDENGTKIFGSSNGWVTVIREDDFGKTVFLTREEAEAALRKMGGDGE